jgi:hypothetical protein
MHLLLSSSWHDIASRHEVEFRFTSRVKVSGQSVLAQNTLVIHREIRI